MAGDREHCPKFTRLLRRWHGPLLARAGSESVEAACPAEETVLGKYLPRARVKALYEWTACVF